jgi:hypothetical protein
MGRFLEMSLTVEQIQERITRVEEDIKKLRSSGAEEKKLIALGEYKEYLKDELKMAQDRK